MESSYRKVVFDIYTKSQLHRGAEYKTILHEIDRVLEKSSGLSEYNETVLGEQPEKESFCHQRLEMSDFDSFLLKTVKMIDSKAIEEFTAYSVEFLLHRKTKISRKLLKVARDRRSSSLPKRKTSRANNKIKVQLYEREARAKLQTQ